MKKIILLLFVTFSYTTSVFSKLDSNKQLNTINKIDKSATNNGTNLNYFKYLFYKNHSLGKQKDIAIKLNGTYNKSDSIHFTNLISTLQKLVLPNKISIVVFNPTIEFWINNPQCEGATYQQGGYFIKNHGVIKTIHVGLYNLKDQSSRNRIITYYLVNNLIVTRLRNQNLTMGIEQSIFTEAKPQNSRFLEIDKLMIKWYNSASSEEFMVNSYNSYLTYFINRNNTATKNITTLLSYLIVIILLLLIYKSRVLNFKSKNLKFILLNGLIIITLYEFHNLIYSIIYDSFYQHHNGYILRHYLADSILNIGYIFFIFLVILSIERVLLTKIYRTQIKLFTQFFTTIIIGLSLYSILFFIDKKLLISQFTEFTLLLSTVAIIRFIYNYQTYKNQQILMQKDIDISKLAELKSKAELVALQSRINPHFLYNSLNSIATLARIDSIKTEVMAIALSDFFRFALNKNNEEYSSIKDEVSIIKAYLGIEKIRFGEKLNYEINIKSDIQDIKIPRFIIQPLIENAVKHGISQITDNGIIKLEITKNKKFISIKVFDNGPDFPTLPLTGHGLQSISDKLNILYKDLAKLNWENGKNKHISITLPLKNKNGTN